MVEKRIRCGICRPIHRYAIVNNKYMKNCDKNIELSYLMYFMYFRCKQFSWTGNAPKIPFKWF